MSDGNRSNVVMSIPFDIRSKPGIRSTQLTNGSMAMYDNGDIDLTCSIDDNKCCIFSVSLLISSDFNPKSRNFNREYDWTNVDPNTISLIATNKLEKIMVCSIDGKHNINEKDSMQKWWMKPKIFSNENGKK